MRDFTPLKMLRKSAIITDWKNIANMNRVILILSPKQTVTSDVNQNMQKGKETVHSPLFFREVNGPPSWSLDASETGESTKCPWIVAVGFIA